MAEPWWVCKTCGWRVKSGPDGDWDTCPNCNNYTWMREGERNNIAWVAEPPTEPGWYWVVNSIGAVDMVELRESDLFYVAGDNQTWPAFSFTHWLGPLPVPEVPA